MEGQRAGGGVELLQRPVHGWVGGGGVGVVALLGGVAVRFLEPGRAGVEHGGVRALLRWPYSSRRCTSTRFSRSGLPLGIFFTAAALMRSISSRLLLSVKMLTGVSEVS